MYDLKLSDLDYLVKKELESYNYSKYLKQELYNIHIDFFMREFLSYNSYTLYRSRKFYGRVRKSKRDDHERKILMTSEDVQSSEMIERKIEKEVRISVEKPVYLRVQEAVETMKRTLEGIVEKVNEPLEPEYKAKANKLLDKLDKFSELIDVQFALVCVPSSSELDKEVSERKFTLSQEVLSEYEALRKEWIELCSEGLPNLSNSYFNAGSVPVPLLVRKEMQNIINRAKIYDTLFSSTRGDRGRKIRDLLLKIRTDVLRLQAIRDDVYIRNVVDPLREALEKGMKTVSVKFDERLTKEEEEIVKRIVRNYKELNELVKEETEELMERNSSN